MELVIFVGLQGSGKTTFYHAHFSGTHDHVSKDRLLKGKHKTKNEIQSERIREALQAQHSIVVDNTNATVEDRAMLIGLGREYGAEIAGYYFDSTVKLCIERNRQREGKEKVPDKVIYITASRLVRPTYAEGFDRLYSVSITGDNLFDIGSDYSPNGRILDQLNSNK